jgi:DNA invertase Pin-like site-specific DNA recombinase
MSTDRQLIGVGIIRNSQDAGPQGPKVQRQTIEDNARARGIVLEQIIQVENVAGDTPLDDWALGQQIARMEAGEIDAIVFSTNDRFTRSQSESDAAVARIDACGGLLLIGSEPLSHKQIDQWLTGGVLARFQEAEKRKARQKAMAGQAEAIKEGKYLARAPRGYARDEHGRLIPGPDAAAMTEAFRLVASKGWRAGADSLGLTIAAARRCMLSRTYLGENRSGGTLSPVKHQPLTTPAIFARCEAQPAQRYRSREKHPLSMLATCDECDGPLIGAITRQKVPQLRCRDGHVAINQELLRAYLLDEVARYARDLTTPTNTAALEQAQEALDAAKHDHQQLATDARLRAAMGDSYVVALEAAQEAVNTAQEAFKDAAQAAAPIPALDQLHAKTVHEQVEIFRRLFAEVRVIKVGQGWTGTVDERVGAVFKAEIASLIEHGHEDADASPGIREDLTQALS